MDLESNISNLYHKLLNGTYIVGLYHTFTIYEPKERIIKSLPYEDRIVQQWIVHEFLIPYYYPRFISNTFACIDNRGNLNAIYKLQKYMRLIYKNNHDYYVIKGDIHKFFDSIDIGILREILINDIRDKKLMLLLDNILGDSIKGIPIGNYTSQYFANIYLNKFDVYIKYNLCIKYYVRYMDDFIILVNSKNDAKDILNRIRLFLNENLKLELNKKTNYYPNKYGVNFCGYIMFNNYILLRKRFKVKLKKTINKWRFLNNCNKLDIKKMVMSYNAIYDHMRYANSYNYYCCIINKLINFNLYKYLENKDE